MRADSATRFSTDSAPRFPVIAQTPSRWIPDPGLVRTLEAEHALQRETLCLIASRSIVHPHTAAATQSAFANVTTEGYPGRRYHAGSGNSDALERAAISKACEIFGADHANVQSHSASTANLAAITALLDPGDTILSMELASGGHLTHGSRPSMTGRYFHAVHYGIDEAGLIDLGEVERLAAEYHPKVIICGASAYTRQIDFAGFRRIADQHGSMLLADISHTAGLVAARLYPNPVPHAHVTTLCTHKQLYGPKGGLLLSGPDAHEVVPGRRETLARLLDRAVFPYFQGSPDMGAIAGKAYALDWAATPEFREVMERVRCLAEILAGRLAVGFDVVSGGTDSHMVLVDLRRHELTGLAAETELENAGILTNRNRVPGDTTPSRVTRGLRLGTNIAAFRGVTAVDFQACCALLADLLEGLTHDRERTVPEAETSRVRRKIAEIMSAYPLP